jgi:hypothetical protein
MTGLNANCKRVCTDVVSATKKVCLDGGQRMWEKEAEKMQEQMSTSVSVDGGSAVTSHKKVDTKLCSKYPELFEPHTFAPKDLLALLKNLENEISVCEVNLRDENDKRKKYKVRFLGYKFLSILLFIKEKGRFMRSKFVCVCVCVCVCQCTRVHACPPFIF